MPWVMIVALSLWIIAVLLTRTISIGSLLAAVVLAPAAALCYPGQWIYFGLAVLAGGLAAWRHRSNIQRLLAGTESRVTFSSREKEDS